MKIHIMVYLQVLKEMKYPASSENEGGIFYLILIGGKAVDLYLKLTP